MSARLVSLNVGLPQPLAYRDTHVPSGIRKRPVSEALTLGATGLAGDGQADLRVHGGPDKAVCVYPIEHYAAWKDRLGRDLEVPAFGENFTVSGLLEENVCLHDVFRIGTATVQVSQPRQPCFKLSALHGEPKMSLWVQQAGLTGFYFRVLEAGRVAPGDRFELLERGPREASIEEINRLLHRDRSDTAAMRHLLALGVLAASNIREFERRLEGGGSDPLRRLEGPAAQVRER
ncbi:MOSC domain-containing protein YiiM [Deinobacterium chartae]|uniref:MOSC domain-containing protein YiiM n=1 Tax=Deinobacterium chartae TaxID=521158 RepID=A0A841I006_9DEIO|nr:MOSC domain-containing protein [Deinobacterium chartae]MBB6099111.1 MOSC domain-containing protein YiiM [Deinobacterium chartae]